MVRLTRPENFDICCCISFKDYCQNVIFGSKNGHEPVTPSKFQKSSVVRMFVFILIIDIKFCFACGVLNFRGYTVNCQYIMSH